MLGTIWHIAIDCWAFVFIPMISHPLETTIGWTVLAAYAIWREL